MVGGALGFLRISMRHLLPWEMSIYQTKLLIIFGIPNTSMSSCQCFRHFLIARHLDKSVAGIPNAKDRPLSARVWNSHRWNSHRLEFTSSGIHIVGAGARSRHSRTLI